ncbi:MAG: DUF305 domain-containing protein, partial [Actinomycetota bacterium]|nr:DUF305 domain-containing protein [Actinomycetota bacterium]
MKTFRRLGLPGLVLVVALVLASCGGNAGDSGGDQGDIQDSGGGTQGPQRTTVETTGGETSGMDTGETTSGMQGIEGMDHGDMGSPEEVARQMVAPNGEYSDAAFVDAMVPHHEGAVEMALVALENAEHEEIRTLAQDIIDAQQAEIELFGQMREGLGGPTTGMSQEEMEGMMGMAEDPQQLAQQEPFDKAFIDAMIPHHQSAIEMAEIALEESENPEIRRIAEDIVAAQE